MATTPQPFLPTKQAMTLEVGDEIRWAARWQTVEEVTFAATSWLVEIRAGVSYIIVEADYPVLIR